jgi:hypothetical protein
MAKARRIFNVIYTNMGSPPKHGVFVGLGRFR